LMASPSTKDASRSQAPRARAASASATKRASTSAERVAWSARMTRCASSVGRPSPVGPARAGPG
jgi:hypothetical protein